MADVITKTTNGFNSAEIAQYYDAKFLEKAMLELRHAELCSEREVPLHTGKIAQFNRLTPRAVATTALTEGVTPDAVSTSATSVTAEVLEYGDWEKITSKFQNVTIDKGLTEHTAIMGQAAGETLDTLIRDEMFTGATVQYAGGKAALTAVQTSDVMSTVELRKAVATLKRNKAPKFEDGMFRGVLSVQAIYELQGDDSQGNFVTANQYRTPDQIKSGEVGRLAGVEIYESNNEKTESSTVTVYSNFIAGKEAVAMVSLANGKGKPRMILKTSGDNDTSNPLDMYSTLSYKIDGFAAKTLNANWLLNVKAA
jgi:N4-gp56 family major capsid protein